MKPEDNEANPVPRNCNLFYSTIVQHHPQVCRAIIRSNSTKAKRLAFVQALVEVGMWHQRKGKCQWPFVRNLWGTNMGYDLAKTLGVSKVIKVLRVHSILGNMDQSAIAAKATHYPSI